MPEVIPTLELKYLNKITDILIEHQTDVGFNLSRALKEESDKAGNTTEELKYKAFTSLLSDLHNADWSVNLTRKGFNLTAPNYSQIDNSKVKEEAKKGLQNNAKEALLSNDEHIQIINKLQNPPIGSKLKPISLIIDDGLELKKELIKINKIKDPEEAKKKLTEVIKPEIYQCVGEETCPITNQRLIDIWRYFRFTWSMPYNPANTRRMPLLIRNGAKPNKPVIGITQFVQPFFNNTGRNEYLHWDNYFSVMKLIKNKILSPDEVVEAFKNILEDMLKEIRFDDLIDSKKEITNPDQKTIDKFKKLSLHFSEKEKIDKKRQLDLKNKNKQKQIKSKETSYLEKSETNKYRKKRSTHLSKILFAKKIFKEYGLYKNSKKGLSALFQMPDGQRAINIALFYLRIKIYSTQAVDLNVCGSIAPYNELLGGKLVTLLMGSKEVMENYDNYYKKYESIISSETAGKKIVKPSKILFVAVSSLYSIASSQYNRLKLNKKDNPKIKKDINWREAGATQGFGNYHISSSTTEYLNTLYKKVNKFETGDASGDGHSAKNRALMSSLRILMNNPETILLHSQKKRNYIFYNKKNIYKYLYGLKKVKDFNDFSSIKNITEAWIDRWLNNRIKRQETLTKLENLSSKTIYSQFNDFIDNDDLNLFTR